MSITTGVNRSDRTAIQRAREKAGMSREELAALAGLSYWTIYRIERRIRKPQRATIAVIALALGTTLDALTENPVSSDVSKLDSSTGGDSQNRSDLADD